MSLYAMVFGENPMGPALVGLLGLTPDDFGRYRDAFVSEGRISIYTRCGGGNRDDYAWVFDAARAHPDFEREEDDGLDSTYCTFHFRFPAAYREELEKLDKGEKFDPSERWRKAIEGLKQPAGAR